jgi:hypothetical protein
MIIALERRIDQRQCTERNSSRVSYPAQMPWDSGSAIVVYWTFQHDEESFVSELRDEALSDSVSLFKDEDVCRIHI